MEMAKLSVSEKNSFWPYEIIGDLALKKKTASKAVFFCDFAFATCPLKVASAAESGQEDSHL
jgi:hypothetical protein